MGLKRLGFWGLGDLGFRVSGLGLTGFRVAALGCKNLGRAGYLGAGSLASLLLQWGLGSGSQFGGFRVQGFRVWGLGVRV